MKIAVYTIALNEERFVESWFNSAKEADYLLIADTGSTDNTVEKARELGINVVSISVKPWRFDDARNASLALLPADIDYCICLDMDEVLVEGWRQHIEEQATGDHLTYKYVWSWRDLEEKTPDFVYVNNKIHKRHGFRWKDMIHEYLSPDRIEFKEQFIKDLEIHHHPDKEKSRNSYYTMLQDAVNENPNNSRLTMYLARESFERKKFEECKVFLYKFLSIENKTISETSLAYRMLADLDKKNAKKFLLKSIESAPDRREGYVNLSMYYLRKKDWANALLYIEQALSIKQRFFDYISGNYAWEYLPYNILAVCKYNLTLDKTSKTYKKDLRILNLDSRIPYFFDLYGEAPKVEKEEQVLFDPIKQDN